MFKKLSFLFVILLIAPKLLLAENVTKLFTQGSYDAAFRAGYADALSGDPESSYIIGRILVEGKGSAKENINDGIDFIKSSAKDNFLKAVVFLAKNYEEGTYTSENSSKALQYYEKAEKLGGSEYAKKVTELSIALSGKISKKSCERYNKTNKKNAYNIGQCIAKNLLEGNASSYFLISFDNGNNNAFLSAAKKMLKAKSNIDLMPLVIRMPDFKRKASKSEIEEFKNLINQNGYDSSFCGKVAKKNRFSKPEKSSSNDAGCALAAEKGEARAAQIAYGWWKNGSNGFPKKKKYADSLLEKLESNKNADVSEILKKYEQDPKLHFKKSMEFIKENSLNKSIVGKSLSFEIELIAEDKLLSFAESYRDVANVIEYVDWNAVDTDILARFYKVYMHDLKVDDEDGELKTPRVKNNFKKIPYNKKFIKSLGALKNGGQLANKFMITSIFNDCDALNYATSNSDNLNIPIDTLQEAQEATINKCVGNLDVASDSMKNLLKKSKSDLESVKIFIEKKLNHRRPCSDYSEFLELNENDIKNFDVDFDNLNSACSEHSIVAYKLASIAYQIKDYDQAYKYAEQSCNTEPSRGCEIVASMLLEKKSANASAYSYEEAENLALDYLEIGNLQGDVISKAMLFDLIDKTPLISRIADQEKAKELYKDLKKSETISAQIQVKKECFKSRGDIFKLITKSCKQVCIWAKRTKKRRDLDLGSIRSINSILTEQKCVQ